MPSASNPINSNLETEIHFNLEQFFNLTPNVVCIADYNGILKKVNPAFSNLLGYSMDELINSPVSNFIYSEDKLNTSRFRDNLKEKNPVLSFENRYLTKNGEIIWLSWTSVSEPESQLIYAIAKDITHVKKLEEERNLLLIDLAKLNADLKKFTYSTSHDLRSPVNNLLSIFNLLDLSKIDDEQTLEYIELLNSSTIQMKNTLNKYVDAVSQEKKINIQLEDLNLENTLNVVVNSINTLIQKSNTKINVDFSEAPEVSFSSFYLQSILLNLISNSIKYSNPRVCPEISVKTIKVSNGVQLRFSDNGIGFDMEKVGGSIFELHQSFHDNSDSKGIGLYLVKSHLESLGGKIAVTSKVNIGTTFMLTFKN
ncbi:PAS domain S-box-containing protein [Gillisia sp. Hel_I_86]|uniref:PAS domain-containing sensor histidine kinase n=1 Tax=Gillisia sp. Hel_I_86 TaxID=1249981 RepID=UPI00119B0AA5|nr:PAS domain-containing sensor histidine kinase [Gillisia sp. Hel_I_86]TVZ27306.1 PAS domain S-box-containing protein [Gillisia sp. Hel_I_86]